MRVFIIMIYLSLFGMRTFSQKVSVVPQGAPPWFRVFDFNADSFRKPAQKFGPFTRWWWPGNDVTYEELKREIKLFAANGFAGVEVQAFSSGLNPKGPVVQQKRQMSWDSPSFYAHLRTV